MRGRIKLHLIKTQVLKVRSSEKDHKSQVFLEILEMPQYMKPQTKGQQEFQVPKMEVLDLIFGYFGGGFSLT